MNCLICLDIFLGGFEITNGITLGWQSGKEAQKSIFGLFDSLFEHGLIKDFHFFNTIFKL